MGVLIEPKEGSYVIEWEALRFDGANFSEVRKILKGSDWVAQMMLLDVGSEVVISQMIAGQMVQWSVKPGEWIVKSPHGRFWFMGEAEFHSQFHLRL